MSESSMRSDRLSYWTLPFSLVPLGGEYTSAQGNKRRVEVEHPSAQGETRPFLGCMSQHVTGSERAGLQIVASTGIGLPAPRKFDDEDRDDDYIPMSNG